MITEKYSINDSFLKKGDKSSFLSNIENKQFEYENVILEHKGNIILVDFWASWCGPCRKGMPKIKELEKKYSDANLKVIYISIDQYPNRWKTASKEEKIWNRNNYWAYNFNESEIYKRFKITHIPRYLIYDKKGEIAFQKGSKSDNLEDIIIDLLNTSE